MRLPCGSDCLVLYLVVNLLQSGRPSHETMSRLAFLVSALGNPPRLPNRCSRQAAPEFIVTHLLKTDGDHLLGTLQWGSAEIRGCIASAADSSLTQYSNLDSGALKVLTKDGKHTASSIVLPPVTLLAQFVICIIVFTLIYSFEHVVLPPTTRR